MRARRERVEHIGRDRRGEFNTQRGPPAQRPLSRAKGQPHGLHRDGRPFTAVETGLLVSASDDEMRATASELAGASERLAQLIMP